MSVLGQWLGREESSEDEICLNKAKQLAGALNWKQEPGVGDALPAPWHWIYFNPVPLASRTGEDGHPERGGFMPPVALPRRMWAGSVVEWISPLRIDERAVRASRIIDIRLKQGSTGALVFVAVQHEISVDGEIRVREKQDIVYCGPSPARPETTRPALPAAQFARTIEPDPVLLFRYSALTYNSHRIHYDREYASRSEGYPGLVVQGPLIATLLLGMLQEEVPGTKISQFRFRGLRPLFDSVPFRICGHREDEQVTLWAEGPDGAVAMTMEVQMLAAGDSGRESTPRARQD